MKVISELETLQNENKSLVKTLEKMNEEMSLSLYAENIICLNAIDDMLLAIESNDKTKALQLTDIIVKECKDIEAVELAKKMKWELEK